MLPSVAAQRVMNLMRDVPWRSVELRPRSVSLAGSVEAWIVPHLEEFDFGALFSRELNYEQELFDLLRSRAHNYDAVVEIGSNVGIYTVFLAKTIGGGGRVFAFEPAPEAFARLQKNLEKNAVKNVCVFNAAVANRAGMTRFFEPAGHLTNGSLSQEFAQQFSSNVTERFVLAVDGEQIQKLVAGSQRCLLKVDVEGAEAEVLSSLRAFILERTPDIVLEVLDGSEPDLNELAFIRERYELNLVTSQGLIRRDMFRGDPRYRDYWLTRKRDASNADSSQIQ